MSTERDGKRLIFECDSCGESDENEGVYGQDDFNYARNELKESGWTTKKIGRDWIHACPKCAGRGDRDVAERFFERS